MPFDFAGLVAAIPPESPLPEFFSRLGDADACAEECCAYTLNPKDPASVKRFKELQAEEFNAVKALVEYVQAHGDHIMLWMEMYRDAR